MRTIPAISLAAVAACVIATQIESPKWDKYAEERAGSMSQQPESGSAHGLLYGREPGAGAEAIRAWEQAHGGRPVNYGADAELPEVHGHYYDARAEPEVSELDQPEADMSLAGYGHPMLARSVPEFDEPNVDISLEGYDHKLAARFIPEFDEPDVDVSLEGYGQPFIERDQAPEGTPTHKDTTAEVGRAPKPWWEDLAKNSAQIPEAPKLSARNIKQWWDSLTKKFKHYADTAGKEIKGEF